MGYYHQRQAMELTWLFHPSPSAARLPVDEPALASIMTHDHAEDVCAFELGSLRI